MLSHKWLNKVISFPLASSQTLDQHTKYPPSRSFGFYCSVYVLLRKVEFFDADDVLFATFAKHPQLNASVGSETSCCAFFV